VGDAQLRASLYAKTNLEAWFPMSQKFRKTAWYPAGNLRVPVKRALLGIGTDRWVMRSN
jgi:hypothetical protein